MDEVFYELCSLGVPCAVFHNVSLTIECYYLCIAQNKKALGEVERTDAEELL